MRSSLVLAALVFAGFSAPGPAQSSASYAIESSVLNQGGRPEQGSIAQSAGYRVTADAIGDGVVGATMSSASFQLSPGFLPAYGPVGEVLGLRFNTNEQLEWNSVTGAWSYAVYRDDMTALPGIYGACAVQDLAVTSWNDAALPAIGGGNFYLVTAANRLGDEGTKGSDSGGAPRPNTSPCP